MVSVTTSLSTTGPIGIGMLSLTKPGPQMPTTTEAVTILKEALILGANVWNGAVYYGTPEHNSLHIIKAYFTKYPEDVGKVVVFIKGCFDTRTMRPQVSANSVRAAVDECIKVLDGVYTVDVFLPGRLDPDITIEETVGALADAVKEGKVGGIGLSECSAHSIRQAAAIYPVIAAEIELSLFETEPLRNGIAEACKEHNVAILAYTPLGKGLLTGHLNKFEDLPEGDVRSRFFPRFSKENFDQNAALTHEVTKVAESKGCTTAQVAIAWVAAQTKPVGAPVIPIPSVSSISRVNENTKYIELGEGDIQTLTRLANSFQVHSSRTLAAMEKYLAV